jgi:hypothetical protein
MSTYEIVAEHAELDPGTAQRYCHYMRARWPEEESLHCQVGYAQEWAKRFRDGMEYEASDLSGQAILRGLHDV